MKKEVIYSITLVAFILSLVYDRDISYFVTSLHTPALTSLLHYLTYIGEAIVVVCLIISISLWKRRKKWIFPLWAGLGLATAITYILKYIIMRPRPYEVGLPYIVKAFGPSFPSAHAAVVISTVPFLYLLYPKGRILWIIGALLVAISRIYLGVHYVSDVIAGIVIGVCSSMFIIDSMDKKWFKKIDVVKKWMA